MNPKSIELAERRARLVAQAEAQRTALAQGIAPWRGPLALADRGLAALHYLRSHPVLPIGAAAMVVALRPRRAVKWLQRGWVLWGTLRKIRVAMRAGS